MSAEVRRPLNELGAAEVARKVAADEVTCEAVVRDCLARIDARDGAIKAWVNFNPELALAQAHALDRGPKRGPLHGVPVGIKDIIDTFDMPTEMGSPIYRGHRRRPMAPASPRCAPPAR
jgi:Asp-tRNA(Asn)/Glu-tRNA(Gln) amidotransferase A subunit family amidase